MDTGLQVARRGNIFEFIDSNPINSKFTKYVLVVGNDDRASDNVISTIMLTPTFHGRDAIPVGEFDEGPLYAKCGKVTYCKRTQLGEYVKTLNAHIMSKIDESIITELGLNVDTVVPVPKHIVKTVEVPVANATDNMELLECKFKAQFYEKQYNELLDKIMGGR